MSRKSNNSSLAVGHNNNPVDDGHTPLITNKSKKVKPIPRQRQPNASNASDAKKEKSKTVSGGGSAQQTQLEKDKEQKAKIAEEIKLNVAAMGMDLLNSSQQPKSIDKVNGLANISSPKGLGVANQAQSMPLQPDDAGMQADDE